MITKIQQYKILLEAKSKTKKVDLLAVEISDYNEDLIKYCKQYTRVFQISKKQPDKYLPNQVMCLLYKDLVNLNQTDVPYLFTAPMQSVILNKFEQGFNERDMLESINGDTYIYINDNQWFLCDIDLKLFFKKLARNKRLLTIVGDTNYCKLFYKILRAFDVNVQYDTDLVKNINSTF